MEDYVSFQQAKALKKLGFDWEVNQCYINGKPELSFSKDGSSNVNGWGDLSISAPTLYQAKKWLIDKFSLVVSSLPYIPDPKDDVLRWRYYVDKYNPYIIQEGSINLYDSFEDALSAGMARALEVIKEKKEDNGM